MLLLLQLEKPVMAKGNVEMWLGDLLREQQASLHSVIRHASMQMSDPGFQIHPFLQSAPAQVWLSSNLPIFCDGLDILFKTG